MLVTNERANDNSMPLSDNNDQDNDVLVQNTRALIVEFTCNVYAATNVAS